jgi:hypothetical protein
MESLNSVAIREGAIVVNPEEGLVLDSRNLGDPRFGIKPY